MTDTAPPEVNSGPPTEPTTSGRFLAIVLVMLAVGVVLAAGILMGRYSASAASRATTADAGFARDLRAHHLSALEMAGIVRSRTEDPAIRALTTEIALSHAEQVGEVRGWLAIWRQPLEAQPQPLAWVSPTGTGTPPLSLTSDGRLPGIPTAEQIEQLRSLPTKEADRLLVDLLIDHHKSGIALAEVGRATSKNPAVRELAGKVIETQSADLARLQDRLTAQNGA